MFEDTIAAIATAMSPSGIGIIRISGEEAVTVADRIFKSKNGKKLCEMESHRVVYGHIYEGDSIIDEVMVILMLAPNSFTKENTVEIDCHGGVYVMKRILSLVTKSGARLAEPGEFTKRAFLNGRIDLTESEAIMYLIASKNEMARKNSVSMLKGSLYKKIKSIRENILYEIAFIESALDDPEHISLEGYTERLSEKCNDFMKILNSLNRSFENGRMIQEGICTSIVGKPNVGKSSFLNMLVGEERAIVTEIAGTTRDTLEESVSLEGVTLNLIDTAGIHSTQDYVEQIGIGRAKDSVEKADLVIFLVDSSVAFDQDDLDIIDLLSEKKTIVLLNKTDLNQIVSIDEIRKEFDKKSILTDDVHFLSISAKEGNGMDEFCDLIKEMFFHGDINFDDEVCISNMRQKEQIESSISSLQNVMNSLEMDMPEDFYSIDLMAAYSSLGFVIGEEVGDDLVDEIFSKFCMGK